MTDRGEKTPGVLVGTAIKETEVDYFATGLSVMRDHGARSIEVAAAILQTALSEMLARSAERRILSKETTRSPRRLAMEAVGAFETAGGLYRVLLAKMTEGEREAFDLALRDKAAWMMKQAKAAPVGEEGGDG